LGLLLHLGKRKHLVGMFYWCALRQQGDEEEADETPEKGTALWLWSPHCCWSLSFCI